MARVGAGGAGPDELLLRNRILGLLAPRELAELRPHIRLAEARRGQALLHQGEQIDRIILPCGAIISFMVAMPDGRTAEAGLVGPEGLVGGFSTGAGHPSFCRAVALIGGPVAVVRLSTIEQHKARFPALGDGMARHADCLIAQLLQTCACQARHPLEKRLARWLLTIRDLGGGDAIPLTQRQISGLLGVQRTSVTAAAARLQEQGLIACARGRIQIADPDALQRASCGCNLPVRLHYERQLGGAV